MSALPKRRQDATEARLTNLRLPVSGGWTLPAREDALTRLGAMGLPQRRDEYWRFTDPAAFNAVEVAEAEPFQNDDETPLFNELKPIEITFVDGVLDPQARDDLRHEGLQVAFLSSAVETDIHWARKVFGRLEAAGQVPVPRPFATLNTAFATDGLLIRATKPVARPVAIRYVHRDSRSDAILHHVVRVDEGASLTLLETGPAAARLNTVMESDIADNATFHHVRDQGRTHLRQAVTSVFARIGRDATYKSFTMTANGVLTRNEHVVEMLGDDSVAHVAGIAIGDGRTGRFHHDDTVFVTHDALRCESRQVFKKVLKNGAVGVFQGKILVKDGAQKTDGYQISQSLLLDEDSQFLAKPELEIYADDVACSHGSTTGAIDETALYYLRSRGIPERDATDLLVLAFLAEALEEVDDPVMAEALQDRLAGWLARHAG
ncbi:protein SufD [Oceaniovalibus guishaninsula JLT2003]|uniref:Protein SufD n=1 Tax=Oceaniovalibus guishaninsula JLT2003 TaxID=1231392 RepID=K2GL71_9RHOB|nr:SufD family Fe-S cluster assembly protein [Oceaniovalibus guishaninsula]EKE43516.1 protein SufD [Oceaniovalibus guishaninsula JLT2003]